MLEPRGRSAAPESRGGDRSHLSCHCLEGTAARASWEVINKRRNVVGFFIFLLVFPSFPICPLLPLLGLPFCAAEVTGATRRSGRAAVRPAFGDAVPYSSHLSPVLARAELSSVGNGAALGWKKRAALSCRIPEHPLPFVAVCPRPAEHCCPASVANSPVGLLVAMSLSSALCVGSGCVCRE